MLTGRSGRAPMTTGLCRQHYTGLSITPAGCVASAAHAVQLIGSRLTPRWKVDRREDGWPAYLKEDVRGRTASNSARIWVRGRGGARQESRPGPNTTWAVGR